MLNFVEQYPSKSGRTVQEVWWILIQVKGLESWSPTTVTNPRRNPQMVKLGSEPSSSTFPTVPYGLHPNQSSLSNAPSVNYQARHFKTVQNSLHFWNSSNPNTLPVNYQATHFPLFLTVFIVATLASQMLLQWTIKQDISRLFKTVFIFGTQATQILFQWTIKQHISHCSWQSSSLLL